jgi:aminoglycoside phosphotransferase (APT) family kinase protein
MAYHEGTGSAATTADLVAKVYGSDRGAHALRALQQLWTAGFRPPSRYRVPCPYGYSPERGTLWQAFAPGTAWADLLWGEPWTLSEASARAAAWLLQLQQAPVQAEARGPDHAAATARRLAGELATAFPWQAARLEALAERLIAPLQSEALPLVPSHGDYHPKNIFLTRELATVIDFDTFGLREAAFDVGYATGQLLIMSCFRLGTLAPGAQAALAFWRNYELGGQATWERVAVHVARTFFQSLHYELCVLRNNRLDLLKLWTDQIEQWLASDWLATLEEIAHLY